MSNIVVDKEVAEVDPQAAATLAGPVQGSQYIAPNADAHSEAEDLKRSVVVRMQAAWMAVGKAEDALGKGLLADAVASIVPVLGLPSKNRPKYAKIAELILGAMGREAHVSIQIGLPDGTFETRTNKVNAYRQFATPYVTMARWEAGMYNKAEAAHAARNPGLKRAISYKGESYTSPVAALKGGVPPWTCFREFGNVIAPKFVDLSKVHASKAEGLGRAQAAKVKVAIREHNDDGKLVKSSAPVAGHQVLTTGLILGLIDKAPEFSQSNFDKINAALLTRQPKPVVK
jgi:hypothetical protein